MDAIEILVNEHALIRQFLDNLSMAAEKLEADERPSKEFFEKALEFARNFTDKFHHFKEEYVMFAQLAQKKGGILDGQIDSLRHQHEHGRNFILEISNSLDGYARGDEIHTITLLENLAAYISLLRHHMHREDHGFYQTVKKEFSENELQGLLELFNEEDQKVGGGTFENNKKLLQEMAVLL
ncbi:MAG: hemerythrin domain-containing protein [Deltaproteobacteria bacterium]|nr:hemerythrin domain-containing protein [Deltaproteobacteria bacterium]